MITRILIKEKVQNSTTLSDLRIAVLWRVLTRHNQAFFYFYHNLKKNALFMVF